ncbi:hypothetical protein ACRAKI_20510 [Saccharothrix isguenensis]
MGLVAGIAHDRGLLDVDARVARSAALPQLRHGRGPEIRWRHLLQQTSQWDGELWGKPAAVDAIDRTDPSAHNTASPSSDNASARRVGHP